MHNHLLEGRYAIVAVLAFVTSLSGGCGQSSSTAGSSAAASNTVAGSAQGPAGTTGTSNKKTCADFGGKGDGTFEKHCEVASPGPLEMKWTGKTQQDTSSHEVATISATNKGDRPVDWGMVSVWCYDASGKQLEFNYPTGKAKRWYGSGSGLFRAIKDGKDALAPGETVEMAGPLKTALPDGLDTCVVEATEWGFEKGDKLYLELVRPNVFNMDIRPKDGFH